MTPTMQRARQLLATALALPEPSLPADVRIGSIEQWDSLAHARLLLAIEELAGRQLDADDVAGIEGIDDIATLLARLEA